MTLCFFCGKEVNADALCYGCGEHVCNGCEAGYSEAAAAFGEHEVDDHEVEHYEDGK